MSPRISNAPYGGKRRRRSPFKPKRPPPRMHFMETIAYGSGDQEDVGLGCERKITAGMRYDRDPTRLVFAPERACKRCLAYLERSARAAAYDAAYAAKGGEAVQIALRYVEAA